MSTLRTRIARITLASAVTMGIGALGAGPALATGTWAGSTDPDALILSEDASPEFTWAAEPDRARSDDASPDLAWAAGPESITLREDAPMWWMAKGRESIASSEDASVNSGGTWSG